jgi:hypothetical protein
MANDTNDAAKDPSKAEEIARRELEREQIERGKAGRLLRLNIIQTIGVGVALVVGLALLAYVLSMSYVLMAILGGIGAVALTALLIMTPAGRSGKK